MYQSVGFDPRASVAAADRSSEHSRTSSYPPRLSLMLTPRSASLVLLFSLLIASTGRREIVTRLGAARFPRSDDPRTMCAGVMRASAIRPEAGASRAG